MPIFDQGYQHWNGRLAGHAWRWLAVARQGVRQQSRRGQTRWLVAVAFVPALMLAAFLVLWGLFEQNSTLLQPLAFLFSGLPQEVRDGPQAYRVAFWTVAFNWFFGIETFFAMLLVATVGPDLVSQDLRFNAIPLYFSRPLRRLDYFLGKLGVIAAFLAAVAIGPAVAAWLLGVAFSFDLGVIRDTWRLLLGSVAYGSVIVLSGGSLMLAMSSISRNSRLVGAMWVGLWIVSNVTSNVLTETVGLEWCSLVSYTANLDRMREELLDVGAARKKFLDLWESTRKAGDAARAAFPFGGGRRRFGAPPPPPPPPPESEPESGRRRRRRPVDPTPVLLRTPEHVKHPWEWSAGLLAGLFAVSTFTLTTRVKSLDRLK
ncbi:MAG: ABC transporter permease [Isosphaeraceae bacterium]